MNAARSIIEKFFQDGTPVVLTDDYLFPMREYRADDMFSGFVWREAHLL